MTTRSKARVGALRLPSGKLKPRRVSERGRPTSARANALAQRNAQVLDRYRMGATLAGIAADLGLNRQRVCQIVKASGLLMPRDYKCAVPDCHIAPRSPNRYCYDHQRRLQRFGDPWERDRFFAINTGQ